MIFSFKGILIFGHEGMWIPSILKVIEGQMKSDGLELSAEDIYSINNSSLKDAIVHFGGGCTAEVVSKQGLILTNHHCGYSQIQQHSSLENNYLKDGFWAMSKSEELTNPGLTATFIVSIKDVTKEVFIDTAGLSSSEFKKVISQNIKKIQNQVGNQPNYKYIVKPFFYGNKYYLITSKTYKDVRLVGAPPSSMGKFGGDTDNWVWPRHTCDFSVFRIYANQDNEPAEISENNIAYNAPVALDVKVSGVKENDFSMVLGFPGKTEQYLTSNAVDNYINIILPARIEMRENSLKHIDASMDLSESNFIKYASKQSRISNAYKKWIGQDLGLRKKQAVGKKRSEEKNWVEKSPSNQLLLERLFTLEEQKIKYQLAYSLFIELWYYGPEIIRFSNGVEKLKDAEEFENKIKNKEKSSINYFKNYDAKVDKEVFKSLIPIYLKHLGDDLEDPLMISSLQKFDNENLFVDNLFEKSKFTNLESTLKVLNSNKKSFVKYLEKDPVVDFASNLYKHFLNDILPKYRKLEEEHQFLMGKYLKSLMDSYPEKSFFSDANSTMRLTYGKVEGSKPRDGMSYDWFTTIDGIMDKYNTGESDFKIPTRLKSLYDEKNYGRYGDNGTLNICFLGSNHTTGGNSGSPALDSKGQLVGINFDRTWESTMSDVLFDENICRNIMVDIRYVLWVIDIYAGAGHLVNEMNLVE
ncbi:S46 family peptidase [Bacteroidota bacterium]|nr:S46 family peptidase [Bacteroidota bacterium]